VEGEGPLIVVGWRKKASNGICYEELDPKGLVSSLNFAQARVPEKEGQRVGPPHFAVGFQLGQGLSVGIAVKGEGTKLTRGIAGEGCSQEPHHGSGTRMP